MNRRVLPAIAATLLSGSALILMASPAQAQLGIGGTRAKGFGSAPGVPSAATPRPGFAAPGIAAPSYTPPKPKTYGAPTPPRPLAPIGSVDSGDTFKPSKPPKGYSTYDHDAPGRKKTHSTY